MPEMLHLSDSIYVYLCHVCWLVVGRICYFDIYQYASVTPSISCDGVLHHVTSANCLGCDSGVSHHITPYFPVVAQSGCLSTKNWIQTTDWPFSVIVSRWTYLTCLRTNIPLSWPNGLWNSCGILLGVDIDIYIAFWQNAHTPKVIIRKLALLPFSFFTNPKSPFCDNMILFSAL